MKRLLLMFVFCALAYTQGFAQVAADGAAAAPAGGEVPAFSGVRTPLFLGGALGFGSGTGVGADRGIGLYQIEPMIGLWYPGFGFVRVGYGLFSYEEDDEKGKDYEVDHSELDFEVGAHLFGISYLTGSFSRVKELSDLGDVAWNEWGLGFGSLLYIFTKTMLFAEIGYRWVLTHYDPFMDKKVHGGRIQLNLGFSAYVF